MTSPASPPAEPQLFSRAFLRLLSIQFLFGLSYSTFLLLPKFLSLELHASATEIGRVAGAATVAAACLAPFVGPLASRFSRRALLLFAIGLEASAALGFCFIDHITVFAYILRTFQGLAWVLLFNVTATAAADLVPERKMAQAIGYLGMAMLCTNALSPGVAEPLAARFGFPLVFAGAAGLVSLAAFAVMSLPDRRPTRGEPSRDGGPRASSFRVLTVHYGSFLMGAGIGTMFTYVQPFAITQGATVVGTFFFGHVAGAVFVRTVFAGLADRIGPARASLGAFSLYGMTVFLTSQLTPALLPLVGVALGVSHGFAYPALTAAGFAEVSREERTQFMSWYTFAFNLGATIATLTLGPVVDRFGYQALFFTAGLVVLSGVPLLWAAFFRGARAPLVRS